MAHILSQNGATRSSAPSGFLAPLLAAALCMMSSLASGEPGDRFTRACALHDLDPVVALDRHRAAQDIAPGNLDAGFMAIMDARQACHTDPAAALAMYQSIMLGPTLAAARDAAWGVLD